jgi:DNA-binding NarL/FixJ family response regulator
MHRILIVDDHGPFRVVVRRMLERDGFSIVGEAVDAGAALAAVRALRPDVVLLDVNLPDDDGFAVCERLHELPDAPAVVLTSSHELATFGRRLRSSRALGFISKRDLTSAAFATLLERTPG